MPSVRGCHFPDDLLYDVANHLWYREQANGTVRVGMDAVAAALAGEVLGFMPRRPGRPVEAGRACATIESGKWVGAARIAFDCIVAAINEPMLDRPHLASRDPYGEGWMLEVTPQDWAGARAQLLGGNALAAAYERWMAENDFPGCGEGAPRG